MRKFFIFLSLITLLAPSFIGVVSAASVPSDSGSTDSGSSAGVSASGGATATPTALPTTPASSASSAVADHLDVAAAATARVGEALDLTVKAVGKDGSVSKDYKGNIYISVSEDPKATVPYADNGYTFVPEDQGSKTFSKGLLFTKEGRMTVTVIDLENEQITGTATVTVSNVGSDTAATSTGDTQVSVTSPSNGSIITTTSVDVVGTTKKNSKVKFSVNGKEVGQTQSDPSGAFLYTVKTLDSDKNALQVSVLDGTDKVIGQSDTILLTVQNNGPAIKSISAQEGVKVNPSSLIHVTLISEPKLKEAVINIKDTVQVMQESTTAPGTYTAAIMTPKDLGDYSIGAKLTTTMGTVTQKNDAAKITVATPEDKNVFGPIQVETSDKKATFTFSLVQDDAKIAKFKFRYGTSSGSLSQESITYDRAKIVYVSTGATDTGSTATGSSSTGATGTGTMYRWYVSGLTGHYSFQIVPLDQDGNTMEYYKSSIVDADVSLNAPSQCTVDNITAVRVKKLEDAYELSWDAIATANAGYDVYKKDATGQFVLIETVNEPRYVVHVDMTKKQAEYAEFAVKGLCNGPSKNESTNFSPSTRVQTGPAGIAIVVVLSLLAGYAIMRRRRTAR